MTPPPLTPPPRASKLKILFFGSGEFGAPTLAALLGRHEVVGVVTQPDRPAGRSRRPTPTPIAQCVAEGAASVPVFKPESVNSSEMRERLRALPAEVFVVIAFGQKLGRELLRDRFAINLHGSLLPRWRGAAPINHAILAGDTESGNSVITLADRMDAGEILGQSRRLIGPSMTAGELHDALAGDGPALVLRVLEEWAAGTLRPLRQEESGVTPAGKLGRADGRMEWSAPAERCVRRINGLSPWPGVSVRIAGERVKLVRAAMAHEVSQMMTRSTRPGTLVDAEEGLVACGGGEMARIIEVQPAGGRVMPWSAFANGRRLAAGEVLASGEEEAE